MSYENLSEEEREILRWPLIREAAGRRTRGDRGLLALASALNAALAEISAWRVRAEAAEGVLASTADAINVLARENGVAEIEKYLTLDVRDGFHRVYDAVVRRGQEKPDA